MKQIRRDTLPGISSALELVSAAHVRLQAQMQAAWASLVAAIKQELHPGEPVGEAADQPVDVRARALQLRQQRNAGPAKPPPWSRHDGHH